MKKLVLAAAALALSAGAAFAENPYVGEPEGASAPVAAQSHKVDYTAPAAIHQSGKVYQDGSANRFGDASPSSFQN